MFKEAMFKILVLMCVVSVTCLSIGSIAIAQDAYPYKPIHVIVPYSAGGPTDFSGRMAARALSDRLPQPVIVENKPGAGGRNSTISFLNAEPDGYTLLVGTAGPLVVSPAVGRVTYSPTEDLIAIAIISRSPQVLAVTKSFPGNTVKEFIAFAKANPGHINIGHAGIGTSPHLAIELLKESAGIDIVHVPYKGTSKVVPDLLSGAVEAIVGDVGVLLPLVLDGQIKGLAVTSANRMEQAPDLPTMAEMGLADVRSYNWSGLFAPKGTPQEVIDMISAAMNDAVKDDSYQAVFAAQGATPVPGSPQDAANFLKNEISTWTPVAQKSNLK